LFDLAGNWETKPDHEVRKVAFCPSEVGLSLPVALSVSMSREKQK